MERFVHYITKFAIIFSILFAVLLLALAGVLLFAPQILLKIVYYLAIIGCLAGAGYIIFSLIRLLLVFLLNRKR